jgi:hypothetical protein
VLIWICADSGNLLLNSCKEVSRIATNILEHYLVIG